MTNFYKHYGKRIFDLILSILMLFVLWPAMLLIAILIKLDSSGPVIFKQKRVGKKGMGFEIYKFRTMIKDAEKIKGKYFKLNEADGPVFKIRDDPRYTRIGKYLARTGLDELPQFINILKNEMSLVGPRPLPIKEAQNIPKNFKDVRESVLPGATSSWVISGAHDLKFNKWMNLDKNYSENIYFFNDLNILFATAKIVIKSGLRNLLYEKSL